MGPERVLEWPQNDPPDWSRDDPSDWSPDALRSLIPQTSETYGQNKGLFKVLLTIAELFDLPSKDWIRPPTRFEK